MENGGATAKYSLHKIGVKFNHKNHLLVSFSRWQLLVQMAVTLGNSWLVLLVNNYFFLLLQKHIQKVQEILWKES